MKTKNLTVLYTNKNWISLFAIAVFSLYPQVNADQFGSGSNAFEIEFAVIGNPGNPPFSEERPYGVVDYIYRIAKYEVSLEVVAKANAEGQLGLPEEPHELIEVPPRPAMAVTGMSWNHAARFVNWLNEDKGFPHAYRFAVQPGEEGYDSNANIIPWTSGDSGYDHGNPFRNLHCRYHLPSFAERFKAAYYDPEANNGEGRYTTYANGTDMEPIPVAGGTEPGTAVWNQANLQGPADVFNAGGLSPWGVMALEGNVWEWEETSANLRNDEGDAFRALSGGSWRGLFRASAGLSATGSRFTVADIHPGFGGLSFGFRIASRAESSRTFQVDSIDRHLNDISFVWSSLGDGWAYTPQVRDLLVGSEWEAVATRYRWPIPRTRWTDAGALQRASEKMYRVIAEEVKPPDRGKLLGSELMHVIRNTRARLGQASYPTEDVKWGVEIHKIVYETVDPFGLVTSASGALIVPTGTEKTLPLMSWQHGTEIYKGSPPSSLDSFPSESNSYYHNLGIFYASSGYVTAMPDYLGLGVSPGLHPYLHAKTEASAVIDMLRAARVFCDENGIALNSQLFLAGYSQGGHATVAAHREIESNHTDEFSVTASAPMAGPYDMSGSLDHLLTNLNYPTPMSFAYALAAWLPIYNLADTLETFFSDTYDGRLVPRLDGRSTFDQVDAAMAPTVAQALDPAFHDAIRNDENHPFRLAAADNDLLDWTPEAPVRLFHCAGDQDVPYWNSEAALNEYKSRGACCVDLFDPTPPGVIWGHQNCYRPSIIGAKKWFDSLKEE